MSRPGSSVQKRALLCALLLSHSISTGAVAQPEGATLQGRITDAVTGVPLPAANILVVGTILGTMSGSDGSYRLLQVPPGEQVVAFSVVGYATVERTLTFPEGGRLTLDVALQPIPLALPDVVVTAGRQAQRAERAAAATGLLTGSDLDLRAALRIDQVLALVPGVTMVTDQVGIRGSTGYTKGAGGRVLVLLDGVPAIGGDTGNVRWDTLPAEVVERVEVVKGPVSSLYGSSAMGGVVNVLTRSAHTGPAVSVRLRAGRWDTPYHEEYGFAGEGGITTGADVTMALPVGPLGLLASGGYQTTDGYRQNGWSNAAHLLLKLEGAQGLPARWSLIADGAREEYGSFIEWKGPNDPYEVSALAAGDRVISDKLIVAGNWRRLSRNSSYLQVQPHLYAVRWRNDFRDNQDRATAVRAALDLQSVRATAWGTLTMGVMGAITGIDATTYGERTVWEGGLFAQNEAEIGPRTTLSAGVRIDRNDTDLTVAHSVLSPRAALIHEVTEELTLRLMVGRGFRAPSVAERFIATTTSGFTVIPNLTLDPETAWSGEVGAVWRPLPVVRVEGGVFTSRYASMIEPERLPDGNIQFRNLTRARVQGAEIAIQAAHPSGRFRGAWHHLWLSARDLDRGLPLAYRRPSQGSLTAEARSGAWLFGGDLLYGDRIDRVGIYVYDRRVPLRRLDGRITLTALGANWTLLGRNLTEFAYTEIERNLSPPREWMLSVTRSWR